jgi:tetratricopeptide (TPR) repeat protein
MDRVVANRMAKELLGKEVGGWEIISTQNSGKSAIVFKATRLGENAAIKIFDPEMVERYGRNTQPARIGRELTLQGKHAGFDKTLDLKRDYAQAHSSLGLLYWRENDRGHALEEFRQAVMSGPDLAEAHYNVGLAQAQTEHLAEAARELSEAISLDPNTPTCESSWD